MHCCRYKDLQRAEWREAAPAAEFSLTFLLMILLVYNITLSIMQLIF